MYREYINYQGKRFLVPFLAGALLTSPLWIKRPPYVYNSVYMNYNDLYYGPQYGYNQNLYYPNSHGYNTCYRDKTNTDRNYYYYKYFNYGYYDPFLNTPYFNNPYPYINNDIIENCSIWNQEY